ncbi:hypothetical protein SAY86_028357 [Trapa natans]|uniref:Uncharacterized protein n=1 Tax=Trapa natans TaxID=22666 RepID=A0AAN7LZ67_TRANT|nr:hypothetical protein SAY86_028357 [Trapa natans]
MASACVNNITMSPDNFPSHSRSPCVWLPPGVSFSTDVDRDCSKSEPAFQRLPPQPEVKDSSGITKPPQAEQPEFLVETDPDPELSCGDFEFCLEDPVAMLPADELFSDGKLVPLQVSALKTASTNVISPETSSPDQAAERRRMSDISGLDIYLRSPKAPRCSSRWKELLGLKKLYQNANAKVTESTPSHRTSSSSPTPNAKSFRLFLHGGPKASNSSHSSLNMPLLNDLDSDFAMISSRLSLSSSSSGGHDHEELPRLSLDSDKPHSISLYRNLNVTNAPRMRLVKLRADSARPVADNPAACRVARSPASRPPIESGVSIDSPRMSSSGKVIFQTLERSSSSPSSFNGGPRFKHNRAMERSYSAGVRVSPVLNVPISSLIGSSKSGSVFGFGSLFSSSPQKREFHGNGTGGSSSRSHSNRHHHHQSSSRNNRPDGT